MIFLPWSNAHWRKDDFAAGIQVMQHCRLGAAVKGRRLTCIADLDRGGEFCKNNSDMSGIGKERTQTSPATLGDVLYANSRTPVPEQDWATLVESIAAGDQYALHALYERAHRLVFTLIMRITANRETAEEVTIDVFHDVWRRASRYDAANGTVLGWIMNQARSRAIDRLRFEQRKKRAEPSEQLPVSHTHDGHDALELKQQCR